MVDAVSSGGWSALHYAANGGHVDVVKRLIDEGAYLERLTDDQMSALDYATMPAATVILEAMAEAEDNIHWVRAVSDCRGVALA